MHLLAHVAAGFELSPCWLVSDGDLTIGPVATELLVRGFVSGRIPRHCQVRPSEGGDWRSIEEVREVRASQQPSETAPEVATIAVRKIRGWLLDARDVGEALLLSLHGACYVTQAQIGVLYRVRAPLGLPVVSACFGDPELELGEIVPRRDPALTAALEGETMVLEPEMSAAALAIAGRLSPRVQPRGIALVPIRTGTDIAGVVELARFDHGFRNSEVRALVPLMAATVARLEELAWDA
ncbi:MAG TPA: hypothetical protein VER33_28910 [Polyangiaceae bacterium]|nr:hypothetical protein [Polyangiaceae bacterium]